MPGFAQEDDVCMMCHEDPYIVKELNGKTKSVFVDLPLLVRSPHKEVSCIACHTDAAVEEWPHPSTLQKVDCGSCHAEAAKRFDDGIHGRSLKAKARYAPDCKECHGRHDILHNSNPISRTYKMNIPVLCGKCHREGAPVARAYKITEHNIIENYSQGIHGKGLFKSGLIVTATCNDCHGNHLVLPHTYRNSSISLRNIAGTCMKCHARIEQVHKKVINEQLWEQKPGAIPACSDCHPPHIVTIQNLLETISDRTCLRCHERKDIHKMVNGDTISLYVDVNLLSNSIHNNITCVKCHSDVSPRKKRPCETSSKVACANCHSEISDVYYASGHGLAHLKEVENAPYCTDCHNTHLVKSKKDESSPVYRLAIPTLCGECHRKEGKAIQVAQLKEIDAYLDYSTSVHGKGLTEKGLLVSAVCTDCHTTHFMHKDTNELSSVHPLNVPATCGSCHKGIFDSFLASDHAIHLSDDKKLYPTCTACHYAHVISEIDKDKFMYEITQQCGSCHQKLSDSYMETYHGKAYQLGYLKAARCSDCHGAHTVMDVRNPKSAVGKENIVATCKKCHEDAHMRFTGFLTHATHHNRDKYPALYYSFWGMTSLLIAVFAFFGIHTLLWLPRSLRERRKRKSHKKEGPRVYIRRFNENQRWTHIFVILSFLSLALTGMLLKFANMEWARFLVDLLGGVHTAGNIHRFAAVITFGYFFVHLFSLMRMKAKPGMKLSELLFGSNSLLFSRKDLREFWSTIKWFLGLGPRPQYGRWTYWEKFDYFAVFWGIAIIGFSGLMLWFPEFFTRFFPGEFINVAQIIHSDEALLAVGFIFTIHFFNTHFRPEVFPMDPVIFTGHVPLEEYKEDRPKEFEELEKSGKLDEVLVEMEISESKMRWAKAFGFFFLAIGLTLIVLILYSLLFGTR
ncbi:MAG: cytochrome c3 family protein [Marinifilaceae bacterium]